MSSALVGLGVWLVRLPLAEFVLEAALSEYGIDADLQVVNLDFQNLTLANINVGAADTPDASIQEARAEWQWNGLRPQLQRIRLTEPKLRLMLDERGRVTAGVLSQAERRAPSRRRASIPPIDLEIINGAIVFSAPFGALEALVRSDGVLGQDFTATAQIPNVTARNGGYAIEDAVAELTLTSRGSALDAELHADAQSLSWASDRAHNASLHATARIPLDLASLHANLSWRLDSLQVAGAQATALAGIARLEANAQENSTAVAEWRADARSSAETVTLANTSLNAARLEAQVNGASAEARGRWTLSAERLVNAALASEQPAASGRFFRTQAGELRGSALFSLARSSLTPRALRRLRAMFPEMSGSPVGPTFANAAHALDAAARSFTLSAPFSFSRENGVFRASLANSADIRAASGARLRISALREDAPALTLQHQDSTGAALHGAIALELAGGGAPDVALLLDTVSWAPDAPFEGDGTLSLSNWRDETANIAANELGFSIALQPHSAGRIELRGPLHITGPIGDGEVRDLETTLDIAATWNEAGWRVAPDGGCLPARLGGVDAAGLSFQNGAFAICALDGALIAADRANNLSGGFSIQSLSLTGRMAGPEAHPAHLNASNITGRFRGRSGDLTLSIEAAAPSLAIAMAEARTLAIQMQRITADAHIANGWRIDGAFQEGTLTDPALPGTVSTIEGAWSAAPEGGEPVIRVTAGEALLTANRPATDSERLLFNPLRLIGVDAQLQRGRVSANGAIVLEQTAQHLARFTAEHDVSGGAGAARVNAASLTFGESLKPYDITERARGLVDNVTGQASFTADINWSRSEITGAGLVRLDGLSLATSTIPVVNDVRGNVFFDDVFALTTPPGQEVTVGLVNPGLAVRNGRVRFQLLTEQRVNIESAEFDFASGVLAMAPTAITLGADETRFELQLRDVDASALLASLNIPDLAATGRVEGEFPLLLSRRAALIQDGVLRAKPGGGMISYTGNAGQSATGPARIAFDALRSFRYDSLSINLNGDLNGEVVSSITFSGENSGRPVDLGPIAPIPGLGRVTVRGVPFDFNVTVTAPFRRLAQTAASFTDPGSLIERARDSETADEQDEPVDPTPASPR